MARRAQFEIMGLAFIMILVMMGILFGLYVMSRPEPQLARDFSQSQLASNWLNAYKGMSTTCHGADITRLLQDCASSGQIDCGGKSSCAFAREITHELLNNTLGSWNRQYNLSLSGATNPGDPPLSLEAIGAANTRCTGNIQRDEQPIPSRAGPIFLRLSICT